MFSVGVAEGLGKNGEGGEVPAPHGLIIHKSSYKSGAVRVHLETLGGVL